MTASSSEPEAKAAFPHTDEPPPSWWASRLGLATVDAYLRRFALPESRLRWAYALGGCLAILLLFECITGLLLLLYYQPDAAQAHQSITQITEQVRYGWLLRNMHIVGASAIVALCILHAVSAIVRRSFRAPREVTWWTGGALGLLVAAFAYTGAVLPWDRSALYAAQVGTSVTRAIPWVGPPLARIIQGGDTVGPATLHRAFAIHVGLLPATLVLLTAWHVLLVHLHGLDGAGVGTRLSTNLRLSLPGATFLWLAALNVVVTTAALSPISIGAAADLTATFEPSRPAWYFMAVFQLARTGTAWGAALTPLFLFLVAGALTAAPWWGSGEAGLRGPKTVYVILILLSLTFLCLTAVGYWG